MMFTDILQKKLPDAVIEKHKTWAELTTLGIGTAVPAVIKVKDSSELQKTVRVLHDENIPFMQLGRGSNIVGSDRDLEMVLIVLENATFGKIEISGNTVIAGSAVSLKKLAETCAAASLSGISPLCGIPGSLGGALAMNAGAGGVEIGKLVKKISGVDPEGRFFELDGRDLEWGYRCGAIPEGWIITEAELQLEPAVADEDAVIKAELERRARFCGRSAGCVFRNAGKTSAGMLIDRAGGKKIVCGGCRCSGEHANFIINTGGGSADDFAAVAAELRRLVWDDCGVILDYEVNFADKDTEMKARSGVPQVKAVVLCGGNSSEREVSLRSGAAVAAAAAGAGLDVRMEDIQECRLPDWADASSLVFPVLHGGFGEDGRIQKLMEEKGITFVGSGSEASALVMDKIASKRAARRAGIPTADWWEFAPGEIPETAPDYLTFPLVAKIPDQGSTVGIELIREAADFPRAMEALKKFAAPVLLEKFIHGVEITVPVIGGKAFPVIEIRSPGGFYDYDAKYVYAKGHTKYFCPPEKVSPGEQAKAAEYAEKFAAVCNCRDLVRVDFIINRDGVPMLLEGNSLPGFTATSLVPKSAAAAGWSFEELVGRLFKMAYLRRVEAE